MMPGTRQLLRRPQPRVGTRDALEASFGTLVEHAAGEGRLVAAGAASGEVAQLRELASGG
jgi:hypothetical protein